MKNQPVVKIGRTGDALEPGYVEVPKGNDRMWKLEIWNRGKLPTIGTATVHRMLAAYQAIAKRYPRWTKTPMDRRARDIKFLEEAPSELRRRLEKPILVRQYRGGPLVMRVTALDGPVASHATKH